MGNAEERAKFDRGEVEAEEAKQHRSRPHGPFYSETQAGGGRYANQFDGLDEEILKSFYEQMGGSRAGRSQQAPENKVYHMDVEFKDSILGGGSMKLNFRAGRNFL